jgi:hypothetical protein
MDREHVVHVGLVLRSELAHLSERLSKIVEQPVVAPLVIEDQPREVPEGRRTGFILGEPLILVEDRALGRDVSADVVKDVLFPHAGADQPRRHDVPPRLTITLIIAEGARTQ